MIFKKSEDVYYTVGNAGDPVGPVLRSKMYETMMQEEKAGMDQVIQILQEKLDLNEDNGGYAMYRIGRGPFHYTIEFENENTYNHLKDLRLNNIAILYRPHLKMEFMVRSETPR